MCMLDIKQPSCRSFDELHSATGGCAVFTACFRHAIPFLASERTLFKEFSCRSQIPTVCPKAMEENSPPPCPAWCACTLLEITPSAFLKRNCWFLIFPIALLIHCALITEENIAGIQFVGHIREPCIVAVGDDRIALRLECLKRSCVTRLPKNVVPSSSVGS